jgi:hypothetical protein
MSAAAGWRPYDFLRLGIVLLVVAAMLGLALLLGGNSGTVPSSLIAAGIVLAALLLATAFGLLWYSRRLRRRQRPEWLETQAWRKDLSDKLKRGPGA